MKKYLFLLIISIAIVSTFNNVSMAEIKEPVVKIEIPTTQVVEVSTTKSEPSKASQAIEATKEHASISGADVGCQGEIGVWLEDKTVEATKEGWLKTKLFAKKTKESTKDGYEKTKKSAKKGYEKTSKATKEFAEKTGESAKNTYNKTAEATKSFADKTVENTKEVITNLNPNKPVTLEGLEKDAKIKILKSQKKELKAAYNSRIKDMKAKVKATNSSLTLSEVQKQHKIYTLNKEIDSLKNQRNQIVKEYNAKIKEIKNR